jgi:hypothetical protein
MTFLVKRGWVREFGGVLKMKKRTRRSKELEQAAIDEAAAQVVLLPVEKEYVHGFLDGYGKGATWQTKRFIDYLKQYREAYDESIFPPRDMEQFDPDIRTAVAGQMGRFLIDNIIEELTNGKNT